jgi:hypothetical protein
VKDVLILVVFLIAFGGLMVWVYRILGEDAKNVHGCQAGGMVLEKKEDEKKETEIA